jgi:hypothetical protein
MEMKQYWIKYSKEGKELTGTFTSRNVEYVKYLLELNGYVVHMTMYKGDV